MRLAIGAKTSRIFLILILTLACVLRVGMILRLDRPQQVPRVLAESDAPTYYVLADNMLSGVGYRYAEDQAPTAKRTPGYPLLIATVFKVMGRNFNALRGVQCVLDVATTFMVFALAVLLFQNRLAACTAALGYAIYPPAILSTTYVMTETAYTFMLVMSVLTCVIAMRTRNTAYYLASGILMGVATLTRPGVFLLPVALLIAALIIRRSTWRGFVLLLVAFCVTMLPWGIRNKRSLGRFIVTSTLVGNNLYKGNHLPSKGAYFWSTDSLLTQDLRAELEGASEAHRDSLLQAEAVRLILENKKQVALLTLKKVPRLWLNLGYGRKSSRQSYAIAGLHLILICLGIYGSFRSPGAIRHLSFVPLVTIVFSSMMYLSVASEVRFVFPLIPLLLPYAAGGLVNMLGGRAWRGDERG
jgi:4-amino-4-deoxy-L-arabinose transferase-like glycosyltransferase